MDHADPQAMLSIGAALLGSPYVLGVDIDEEALEVAQSNVDELFDGELPVGGWWASGRAVRCAVPRCVCYDAPCNNLSCGRGLCATTHSFTVHDACSGQASACWPSRAHKLLYL